MWPAHIRAMVCQPRVSRVTIVITQASTKNALLILAARSAVGRPRTVRATAIGSTMHISVLVAKSAASSTRGASVSDISHSGITVCSSTWLVISTPLKNEVSR